MPRPARAALHTHRYHPASWHLLILPSTLAEALFWATFRETMNSNIWQFVSQLPAGPPPDLASDVTVWGRAGYLVMYGWEHARAASHPIPHILHTIFYCAAREWRATTCPQSSWVGQIMASPTKDKLDFFLESQIITQRITVIFQMRARAKKLNWVEL